MKKTILLALCLVAEISFSQNFTLSGYIEDEASGERLIGTNVFVPGTQFGTSSNTYGFYSLTLPPGDYEIRFSSIGYESQAMPVSLTENVLLDVKLKLQTTEIEAVEITIDQLPAEDVQMSTINLPVQAIKKLPLFLGEVDIIKAIQLLPGVQSGNEGTTGFYVRGGSPDQNLILLDGVPVYNASHLFGFFSVFNTDAIKNVQLVKGGFPARFGGRLSSVLEIDMKEGNMKEFHGEGSIGFVASKLTLEGPIVRDKTSFIVSGRRTYIDVLSKPFLDEEARKSGYYFGDLNVKLNHIFSRKDRLYLSYYGGLDKFSYEDEFGNFYDRNFLKWGNNTGSLRWNHLISDKLFSNTTATFTEYEFRVGNETKENNDIYGFEYFSRIRDYGLKYDMEYIPSPTHRIKTGASYTYHIFNPGVAQIKEEFDDSKVDSLINLSQPVFANDIFIYAEDLYNISDRWQANFGLHYSLYFTNEVTYSALQPRISTRYLLTDDWSIKGSYAMMNQYVHLLSNSGIGLPTDLWVSSTQRVKPQLSNQVALGTTKNLAGKKWELSFETYYKWMENLIEYQEGASFLSTTDWQNTVETDGRGEAYGFEFLVRKNEGKTTGWIGYTLAWSNRQFDNLNEGNQYPYRYDRRHDVSVVVNHKFSEKFDMGLTWVYGTGISFTAPVAEFHLMDPFQNGSAQDYTRYTDRNALRMPSYHRLDLGFNFHKETRWGKRIINISFYNAYNRRNPYFIYIDNNPLGTGKEVKQASLFPIIPSIAYIFQF